MGASSETGTAGGGDPAAAGARGWAARWIPLASLLTLFMFAWLGYHAYATFHVGQNLKAAYVSSERLRDLICELEQRLLVAAVMAVGTGEETWLAGYEGLQQRLEEALDAAYRSGDPGYDHAALARMRQAHAALRADEERALAAAADGENLAGLRLLSAPAYQQDVRVFTAATNDFIEAYRGYVDQRLHAASSKEIWSLIIAFVVFALSMAIWLVLAGRLERWRVALAREAVERRRAEAQLLQSQKMEAVGLLASGVAHEFNNLLTAINGYVGLARDALAPGHEAMRPLQRLAETTEQANGLTRALLTFGRREESERAPVNLAAVLADLRSLLQGMLPAAIDVEVRARPDLWVEGDRGQLQQALLNLAINARDAMPQGGSLRFVLDTVAPEEAGADAPSGGEVLARLRVIDNGHGMGPEQRERAFEPFFTTKPRGQGTGLGLAVVHGIVAAHGGRLSIDSVPERGTTVSLLLPATVGPAPPAPERPGEQAEPGAAAATVLVAEDHRYVREIVATTLRAAGHRVLEVADGPSLLAAFEGGASVDLAVIDLDLPGRSGLDCLMDLRARGLRFPAVMVTGTVAPDLEDRLQGEALLLRKPFEMGELTRIVARMLRPGGPQ